MRTTSSLIHRRWKHVQSTAASLERVCIVGSGPAGFYTAKYLMKEHPNVKVDLIEALPTPFGLVRSGVAPDHPEVKSVMNDFDQVAMEKRFSFLGNCKVGRDVQLNELQPFYNAIVLAYGAADDRKLNIPGEDLQGVLSARSFVNWYNSHPDFQHLNPSLKSENALVIGQGNVAIDCARILSKDVEELRDTDISEEAIRVLSTSEIRKVTILGRRGFVQAAFTMKELRELTKLNHSSCLIDSFELKQSATSSSLEEIKQQRAKKRMANLLEKVALQFEQAKEADRQVEIKFLSSPVEFLPDLNNPKRVGAVRIERTELQGEPFQQKAVGTGQFETIPCGLVLKSIGYKSTALDGAPFDSKRCLIPNEQGRVLDESYSTQIHGLYCAGWLKRGPSGIIGTNIIDARETVASILTDAEKNQLVSIQQTGGLNQIRKNVPSGISWDDYQRIDAHERRLGQEKGKPRVKLGSMDELLQV